MEACDELPPWIWPRAAYIHIPFCAHHCGYCDFAVAVGQDQRIGDYINALSLEMSALGEPQPVDTLFFGGGTPTHLSASDLERLLQRVLHWLPLKPGHEFSVEANPGTLTADKIAVLADCGVNRVSLGAQSFHPHLLQALERDHVPPDVALAVERVRHRIANVSLDLIFGVPGQSLAHWQSDLDNALALAPSHMATYGLTYEKGTRLWKQRQRKEIDALDEEAELALYTSAMDVLGAAGFEHYEISNFARSGFRCRHNQMYWANEAHFGFGMGAASYLKGVRSTNTRDLATYLRKVAAGESPHFQSECLPPHERAVETAAMQLRRGDGIERARFRLQTGFAVDEMFGPVLGRLEELGLVMDDGPSVRLTRQGRCLADAVATELMRSTSDIPSRR